MNFKTTPLQITFYEKPGCAGNEKQKKLLLENGIRFETKSILDTKWDKKTLSLFFKKLEKEDIINKFAPQIKKGELEISKISKDDLIDLMCKNPILIKRPLLEIGDYKICGFNIEKINTLLVGKIPTDINISTCQKGDSCIQD